MPDDRFVMEEIARGPQGPQGPRGPQGPKGADGTVSFDNLTPAQKASLNELGISGASVGDLVRVKTVDASGKPTTWSHVPLCNIKTNKNLLDNWYFVGGGSQRGDGIFPINQRGLTTYSGAGYSIDRWYASNSNGTLTVRGGGFTLAASSSGNAFVRQLVKKLPSNTVVTVSALIQGTGSGVLRVDNADGTAAIFTAQSYDSPGSAWTLISGSGTLPDGVGIVTFRVNESTSINVAAIKMELGTEQTLAHREGNVWVQNEIPDYGEELAKCQRHYVRFSEKYITTGFVSSGAKRYYMPIYLPQPMDNPTVNMASWTGRLATGYCVYTSAGTPKAPTTIGIYQKSQNFVCAYDDVGVAFDNNNNIINYMIDDLEVSSD